MFRLMTCVAAFAAMISAAAAETLLERGSYRVGADHSAAGMILHARVVGWAKARGTLQNGSITG